MYGLERNRHIAALSKAEQDALQFAFVEESHADNSELTRWGEPGDRAFILIDGIVDVVAAGDDGIERVIGTLEPGSVFGLLALLDGAPSSATCRTRGSVRVATLSRHAFKRLESLHAPIGYAFRRALGNQLAADFRRLVGGPGKRADVTGS